MEIEKETAFFLSKDGLKLHYRYWYPETASQVVCVVHGHGEHSGRYLHVGEHLAAAGAAVLAMDLRGHGLSEGKRGHTPSYDHLLSDVEELLKTARAEYTDLPLVLMGHSMGGNIVANYVISMNTNELTAFVLSAPWLRLAFDPPAWKVKAGRILRKIWPAISQPSRLDASLISKLPDVVTAYQTDPLVHGQITPGLYFSIMENGEKAIAHAGKINLPGLVYHGTADGIISWKGTEAFVQNAPNIDWHPLKGVYHEPHNDAAQREVLDLLLKFVKKFAARED